MTSANAVLDAIASMKGADLPHIHAPTTVGDIVRQLLERHPLVDEITHEDARRIVAQTAALDGANYAVYRIGEKDGGNLAGPGTWASVGKGGEAMYQISGTVPLLYPQSDPAVDPTLLERATADLRVRVKAMGGDPDWVRLLDAGRAAFGGEDVIGFATPATPTGRDEFHVHFSHIKSAWTPGIEKSMQAAAASIVNQHRHADDIARRIDLLRRQVLERFGELGREVGETTLIGVEGGDDGITSVKVATRVVMIGNAFEPRDTFIPMADPYNLAKGDFDAFHIHSRDTRRRLGMLAGRAPLDAYTMCPVVARDYAVMDRDRIASKATDVRRAMGGRDAEGPEGRQGADFIDGRLNDTVYIGDTVTFRNRTLMARGIVPPDSVMMSLPGRPLTDVVPDARLEGLIVDKAKIDSKGRLTVTIKPVPGVQLRPVLEAMEARR